MDVFDFCNLCTDDTVEVRIYDQNPDVENEVFKGSMWDAEQSAFSDYEVLSFDLNPPRRADPEHRHIRKLKGEIAMVLSKEAYDKIVRRYSTLILTEDDAVDALDFAHDILNAEADATKEKYPYATRTIDELESAAFRLSCIGTEIDNEEFSEGG